MAVRTGCRSRGRGDPAGVCQSSHSLSASFSKRWLSSADHRPIPHCLGTMACGAANRNVRVIGAVSLLGSALTL